MRTFSEEEILKALSLSDIGISVDKHFDAEVFRGLMTEGYEFGEQLAIDVQQLKVKKSVYQSAQFLMLLWRFPEIYSAQTSFSARVYGFSLGFLEHLNAKNGKFKKAKTIEIRIV